MGGNHDEGVAEILNAVNKVLAAQKAKAVDPEILFLGASYDDLKQYKPEYLAQIAISSEQEIRAWDRKTPTNHPH